MRSKSITKTVVVVQIAFLLLGLAFWGLVGWGIVELVSWVVSK